MSDTETRALIERELERLGVVAESWREGDDGLEAVLKHRWGVIENNEDKGLYEGDEGFVTACVVGAAEFHNQRVCFTFTVEDHDEMGGSECRPFEDVEALS